MDIFALHAIHKSIHYINMIISFTSNSILILMQVEILNTGKTISLICTVKRTIFM